MKDMHKQIILVSLFIAMILAAGILLFLPRQNISFDGDRISSADRFALRFDRMNRIDSQTMVLQENDSLRVTWQIESGRVDVVIGTKGDVIYQANGRTAGDEANFYVMISQTGLYTITVSAREASGQISFLKMEME